MSRRVFTDAEKALVRERYAAEPAAAIAVRIGATISQVYAMSFRLGLTRHAKRRHYLDIGDRVRELHARGLSDSQIAREIGCSRETVGDRRRAMGLPLHEAAVREGQMLAIASQRRTLGIRGGGELRALGLRRYAREQGWPEDLPMRAVQILNVLAEHGPKTRPELAELIGSKVRPGSPANKGLKILSSSAHSGLMKGHGTYTGYLIARGLIAEEKRWYAGGAHGHNRARSLYYLTPHAIAIRENCLARLNKERDPSVPREPDHAAGGGPDQDAGPERDRGLG